MKLLRGHALGLALAACCASFGAARACSVCGCGDPLVAAGDSTPMVGSLRLALEAEYLSADARSDDDPSATESLTQLTLRPVAVYSPLPALNLVLQVPLVRKDWSLTAAGGNEAAQPIGLGDLDLGARWFLWSHVQLGAGIRQELALSFGSSFPTGPDDARVDGARIDDHAQLGTGGFGPYLGALYAFHGEDWTLSADVSGRVHTVNGSSYRNGPALLWALEGQYHLGDRFALGLGLDGRYAGRDTLAGEAEEHTGGLLVSAAPSASFGLSDSWWLRLGAQLPVATKLFGVQHVGPVVSLSIQYLAN